MKESYSYFAVLVVTFLLAVLCQGLTKADEPSQLPPYRFVTSDPCFVDNYPRFSPDGKTLLFCRSVVKKRAWELYTVPVTGGKPSRLVRTSLSVLPSRPSWSRRTGLVAFTGADRVKAGVWLIEPDGSAPRALAVDGLSNRVFYPSWYPDGRMLAIVDYGHRVIKQIDIEKQTARALTDPNEFFVGQPSVSADGMSIAFAGQRKQGGRYDQSKNRIFLLDQHGAVRELDPESGRNPSWSPCGDWIAFRSNRGSEKGLSAIFVASPRGKTARQLTSYELGAHHPSWSPDGKYIAFPALLPNGKAAAGIAILEVPTLAGN